jgi:hypothetical protein
MMNSNVRRFAWHWSFVLLFCVGLFAGCATKTVVPPKATPQIDTSSRSTPVVGMSGIYFYQWKSGVFGSGHDVSLVIDGKDLGGINTGEWLYFEIPAGTHKYKMVGGPVPIDVEVNFEAGRTYFFRGKVRNFMSEVFLMQNIEEIQEAFQNIQTGRYKKRSND